jgi:hypothetical protein
VEEADDFRCPLCPDARFASARALERHLDSCGLEERTEEPIHTCPLCARTFPAQDELMVHSATCGEDVDAPAVARCAFSSARFDSAQSVLEHRCESAWAVDPANACPICQDSFPSLKALERHAGNCGLPRGASSVQRVQPNHRSRRSSSPGEYPPGPLQRYVGPGEPLVGPRAAMVRSRPRHMAAAPTETGARFVGRTFQPGRS